MTPVEVLVCDFGGVLTSPLMHSFAAFQESSGVPLEALGRAMGASAERDGEHPLFALEKSQLSERDFLAKLETELEADLGRPVSMGGFAESYFKHLETNHEILDFVRALRSRGLRTAILTNNVREWEPQWRAMIPVDELFEQVIDSAFVGMRKPEREIYDLTLDRLGVAPAAAVLLDDIEVNCAAAREVGMRAVWFQSNVQAIADVEQILAEDAPPGV